MIGLSFLPTRHLSSPSVRIYLVIHPSLHRFNSFSSCRTSHHHITSHPKPHRLKHVQCTLQYSRYFLPCTNPSHMHLLQKRSPSACPYHNLSHKHDTSTYLMCFTITLFFFSIPNRLSHVLISTILNNQSTRHI